MCRTAITLDLTDPSYIAQADVAFCLFPSCDRDLSLCLVLMQSELAGSFAKNVTPSAEMVEVLVDGARYGDIEDVQSALQHSVDVNATDSSGRTGKQQLEAAACRQLQRGIYCCKSAALHMAAANNHADVAETLIEAGAVSHPDTLCLQP